LIWVGEMAGAFVMFVSSVYFLVRFLAFLESDLKLKPPVLGVISEGYMNIINNVVMLVILLTGVLLSGLVIKLVYQLLKLPKQRLSNQQ